MSVGKALLHSSFGQYFVSVVSLAKIVVVSRVLEPEEIGVFAIAMAVVFFVQVVRVFGVFDYIVSRKDLDYEQLRSCFSVMIFFSSIFALLFWVGARPFADYFGAPELETVFHVLIISLFLNPMGMVASTVMYRDMKFLHYALVQAAAAGLDFVVVVALAVLGFGPVSLAWGVVAAGVGAVGVIACIDRGRIAFWPTLKGWGPILSFGWISSIGLILTNLGVHMPALFSGKFLSPTDAGYYSRGQAPITFFRQAVELSTGRVVHSWFAQTARSAAENLKESYLVSTSVNTGFSWPFYVILFFQASIIIPLMLGERWGPSIPVAQALAVGGAFTAPVLYGLKMFLARGMVRRQLGFETISQSVRIVLLYFGVAHGLTWLAWSYSISNVFSFLLMMAFLARTIDCGPVEIVVGLWRSFVVTLAVAATQAGMVIWLRDAVPHDLLFLALSLLVGGLAWLAASIALKHDIVRLAGPRIRAQVSKFRARRGR